MTSIIVDISGSWVSEAGSTLKILDFNSDTQTFSGTYFSVLGTGKTSEFRCTGYVEGNSKAIGMIVSWTVLWKGLGSITTFNGYLDIPSNSLKVNWTYCKSVTSVDMRFGTLTGQANFKKK